VEAKEGGGSTIEGFGDSASAAHLHHKSGTHPFEVRTLTHAHNARTQACACRLVLVLPVQAAHKRRAGKGHRPHADDAVEGGGLMCACTGCAARRRRSFAVAWQRPIL